MNWALIDVWVRCRLKGRKERHLDGARVDGKRPGRWEGGGGEWLGSSLAGVRGQRGATAGF